MVTAEPGVVVLVRFPFSDLSSSTLRPAVILAHDSGVEWGPVPSHEQRASEVARGRFVTNTESAGEIGDGE
jgi:hypothetical protein